MPHLRKKGRRSWCPINSTLALFPPIIRPKFRRLSVPASPKSKSSPACDTLLERKNKGGASTASYKHPASLKLSFLPDPNLKPATSKRCMLKYDIDNDVLISKKYILNPEIVPLFQCKGMDVIWGRAHYKRTIPNFPNLQRKNLPASTPHNEGFGGTLAWPSTY